LGIIYKGEIMEQIFAKGIQEMGVFTKGFFIALLSLGLMACGQSQDTEKADGADKAAPLEDSQQSDPSSAAGPAFWKLSDDDTTIYLFGTVHILHKDINWKNDALETAWNASPTIYFETDTGEEGQQKIAAMIPQIGLNAPGVTLQSFFTDEQWALIEEAAAELSLPIQSFQNMRPWLVGVLLSVQMIMADGGDPESGVETILRADALAAGKSIRYFESVEQQIGFFADMSDEDAAELLYEGLVFYNENPGYFQLLVDEWLAGNVDAIADIMIEGLSGPDNVAEVLLYSRNRNWVEELSRLMNEEEGVFFVAVGAGHLAGEKSVQDYLQQQGFTVERQ
jgi:uncharacterized protein